MEILTASHLTKQYGQGPNLVKALDDVSISIHQGEFVAIIGTSGIVRPFSSEAFVNSIRKEIQVARALGCTELVINSGAKSENYLRSRFPHLPPQAFVHYGNYIGDTLRLAEEEGITHLTNGHHDR